jgi:hypothetical protein
VSDLCAWLSNAFAKVWIADIERMVPWLYLQASMSFIRDVSFNLAHWIFAFYYWGISLEMKCLLENKKLTANQVLLLKVTNAIFLALAVIMPLIYCVTFAILNMQYPEWAEPPI